MGEPKRSRGFDWYRLLPSYWFQNDHTDREWDALLNELLDRFTPREGYMTAHLGPVEVWTENWPYAYGYVYGPVQRRGLPMVRTRRRLRKVLRSSDYATIRAVIATGGEA